MIRLYGALAAALSLSLIIGGCYLKGRSDGRAVQAAEYAQELAEAAQAAAQERQALQAALDARTAELAKRTQEAADAVEHVRTEYLPGKTIVRREVVEVPAYRDCRVTGSVRDAINGALAGRPVSGAVDGGGAARVPGAARADG